MKLLKTLGLHSIDQMHIVDALNSWGEIVSSNIPVYCYQNALDVSVPKAGYILKFETKQNRLE